MVADAPRCPYCGVVLAKMPAQRTRCKECGSFMLVRTSPSSRARVLVTAKRAEELEREWAEQRTLHDAEARWGDRFAEERAALSRRFGKPAGTNDVIWSLLNQELVQHAQLNDWGHYRNTKLKMAEVLGSENRASQALNTYLEICYFDLNGPNNRSVPVNSELLRAYPAFDPVSAFLAPGVLTMVLDLASGLGYTIEDIERVFVEAAGRARMPRLMPMAPDVAWRQLRTQLLSTKEPSGSARPRQRPNGV